MYPEPPDFARRLVTAGVTGTNGKTTTVTWIARALRAVDPAAVCITTLGHWLGEEPFEADDSYDGFLSVMRAGHERGARLAAIELTSMALGLGFARGWPCRVGVFTNLTRDHLDLHRSPEHYLASKAQLFTRLPPGGTAILNGDDPASELLAEVIPAGVSVQRFGHATADLQLEVTDLSWQGTRVRLRPEQPGGRSFEVELAAIGEVYAQNLAAALLAASAMGVDGEVAAAALSGAPAPPGRFEVIGEGPRVVVDYAHTPDAVGRALATCRALGAGRLTVVLGAGGDREHTKRRPMGEAAAAADRVILTSDNPRGEDPARIAEGLAHGLEGHADVRTVLDRRAAIAEALDGAAPDDVVLVAGKGHERDQIVGTRVLPFSDAEVARELLGTSGRR